MAAKARSTPAPARQDPTPTVFAKDGHVFANSRDVALHFGKRHDDVLRRVRALMKQAPGLALRTFAEGSYTLPETGPQQHACFDMTRDGFSLLAMGFTGAAALRFKLAYIDAFNRMEAELREPPKLEAPKPKRPAKPRRATDITFARDGLAVMRLDSRAYIVDLTKTDLTETDTAVCFDSDGTLLIEPVKLAWPHQNWGGRRFGHTVRGHSIAGSAPVHHIGVWVIGAALLELHQPGQRPTKRRAEPQLAMDQPRRAIALSLPRSSQHPRRFEPGSDLKRDLLLLVRSARERMTKTRGLDLGQALAETLEDVIAREEDPLAPVRGVTLDWDHERATDDLHAKMRAEGKDPTGLRAREVMH